ncbi:MAG: SDR family oxidoreductase [Acidobacteria bacterium]|nr:SDR family oxidoreductase [Acidobacteriota bacterium]
MAAREISNRFSTVLITGGTDGLGRAAAVMLAEHSYRVFAAGRDAARREALAQLGRERGLPLETVEMDVCDDASVERALAEVRARAGPIDVLINSAGISYLAPMELVQMEHLRRQLETNFFGAVRVTQRVLPEMRERRRGCIVNMSSAAGRIVLPLFGPYSSSKFALEAMSDALRLELHPFGINVVLIEPGYIPTGFQAASVALSSPYAAAQSGPYATIYKNFLRERKTSVGQSPYTPEDCARVILRALRASPPRPRYTVTRIAQVAKWVKRLLSDRALDSYMIRTYWRERS